MRGESLLTNGPHGTPATVESLILSHNSDDWHSAHFGFPGRACYHSAGYGDRTIRIFHSNPLLDSNDEVLDPRTGMIDVQFRVEASCRNAIFDSITQQLDALDK